MYYLDNNNNRIYSLKVLPSQHQPDHFYLLLLVFVEGES